MVRLAPEDVVEIIRNFKTDNCNILRHIAEIALEVSDATLSVSLLPLVLKAVCNEDCWIGHDTIIDLLAKWSSGDDLALEAALDLSKSVVAFQPDTKELEEQPQLFDLEITYYRELEPRPRFSAWEYRHILEKGIGNTGGTASIQDGKYSF